MVNDKCIVIPAAGASARLGQPKQLVKFRGKALVRLAVESALEVLPRVIVVVGCEGAAVRKEIAGLPVVVVENPDWKTGMGKSIAVGLRAALDQNPRTESVLIHLCDQPTITVEHLNRLVNEGKGVSISFTRYEDAAGVPANFGRESFDDLLRLDGDHGAKELIERCDDSEKKPVEFKGRHVDVDRPGDLRGLEYGNL